MLRRVLLRMMLLVMSDSPYLMMSKRGRIIERDFVFCLYLTYVFVLCTGIVFGHPFMVDIYPCIVVDMSSYIYVVFL